LADKRREADLFFRDLLGTSIRPQAAPSPSVTAAGREATETARLFDRIVHGGESTTEVFFESDAGDPASQGPWTVVALPRSPTPPASLRAGDLVVQRALGDGWLASLRVLDDDIDRESLYGEDGCIGRDTLVLRAGSSARLTHASARPASVAVVESDAESPPTRTSVVASPRRTGGQWFQDANARFLGNIPPRTSSTKGSDVLMRVRDPHVTRGEATWHAAEATRARDRIIVDEIKKGNIPDYLRQGKIVTVQFTGKDRKAHAIAYQVMPDYLAVGTDDDYVVVPLTPAAAQEIADALGCILPTAAMVDQIFDKAGAKLDAQTRAYYMNGQVDKATGKKLPVYDPTTDSRLVTHKYDDLLKRRDRQMSTAAYLEHDLAIKRQLEKMNVLRGQGMPLTAGHKKDLVIAAKPNPKRLHFYGLYTVKTKSDGSVVGTPIQAERGKGLPVGAHEPSYVDYSHGVRLVAATMVADGKEMSAAEVLAN
jgi:hypothetical protein